MPVFSQGCTDESGVDSVKYIIITLKVSHEGEHYESECLELGTASFGSTEEEAISNVLDATEVYLNTLEDLGECDHVLKEKSIQIHTDTPAAVPYNASSTRSGVIPLGVCA